MLLLYGPQLFIFCCENEEPGCFEEKERKPGYSSSVGEEWMGATGEKLRAKKKEGGSLFPSPSSQAYTVIFFSSASA